MNMTSIISIKKTLQQQSEAYSLYQLIKSEIHAAYAFPQLAIELIIPAFQRVYIVDDLYEHGFMEIKITLLVKKDAYVQYKSFIGLQENKAEAIFDVPVQITQKILCDEEYAHADVLFCYKGKNNQKVRINTRQEHHAAVTKSSVVIKAVLDDEAQLQSNTLIFVEKNAHRVDAFQTSKNIMLSSKARAIAVPQLEVLANDVACKHGAAMSMIDSEALFYLQSRGLSELESKQLIIDSFLQ
jgi:Fe-S cluster assembly scaffold protein SufB